MPFDLINAPATFQSLMNEIFGPYLRRFILVFFDDILVYSRTLEEYQIHLSTVLQLLRQNKLFAKMSKCDFAQPQIDYLGHIISGKEVQTDPSKITAMEDWPLPTTVKALKGFLGLTGYYRRFIQHYGQINKPLTLLLKKGSSSGMTKQLNPSTN